MRLAILFWFYRDVIVCKNRLRQWRSHNPGVPIFGLFGGEPAERSAYEAALAPYLDDFWAYPEPADPSWKWRNGDLVLSRWFAERGRDLAWDTVWVAQWDLVAVRPIARLVPRLRPGELLLSGLRPVREVEPWWQWVQGTKRQEYDAFLAHVTDRFGPVEDPLCCQFIGFVAPRRFLERYAALEPMELGFLEYKLPILAQVLGIPFADDPCFRPWWAEDPTTASAKRSHRLVHAWPTELHLGMILYESHRPGGRRVFHPFRSIYPHDAASVGELMQHRRGKPSDGGDRSSTYWQVQPPRSAPGH